MADYSTTMHGPADSAPDVTDRYCLCQVCNTTWQYWGENDQGCPFCDAPADAITVISEHPDYSGSIVRR